jgi:shikimate kinase|tara:strand:+ start:1408 stop:1905 length:498 start_codon:yes stop_codon:yes gene_type:complete
MNYYLIGMMGSGKSTVGKLLAKKLETPFLDLDHYIEVKNNKSINDIFKEKGENYFRQLETNALSEIKGSEIVVACGGGIILNHENRKKISSNGKVVFLKASISSLIKRLLSNKDRPLLNDKNIGNELIKIWNERKNYYNETAEITINTDGYTPESISSLIIENLN